MINPETLGPHITNVKTFYGSKTKPFLAPRGVHVHNGKLFVSDTGQNRSFIWNELPTGEHAEPDVILGQDSIESSDRNSGGDAGPSSLQYPSGIWSDGDRLVVADAWNHRVLIWNRFPTVHGQPADVVLGQKDFGGNLPNVEGIGKDPTASTLNWPYGVFSDGEKLWIADTGNRRVVVYNHWPTQNFQPADDIIGKPDFNTKDYESNDPIWPYSVKVNDRGVMSIADTQFYRNLIWKDGQNASHSKADLIIGQQDFESAGQNQFLLFPNERTLNWTYDSCFYKDGILINDTGNSRILWFEHIPTSNNAMADKVIGKRDFKTSSDNKETLNGTSSSIYWPFSICTFQDKLIIADTGNHRLVMGDLLL